MPGSKSMTDEVRRHLGPSSSSVQTYVFSMMWKVAIARMPEVFENTPSVGSLTFPR